MLDTYAAYKRLRAAGFDEPQAEAIVRVLMEAIEVHVYEEHEGKRPATKADVSDLKAEITSASEKPAGGNRPA